MRSLEDLVAAGAAVARVAIAGAVAGRAVAIIQVLVRPIEAYALVCYKGVSYQGDMVKMW
jgi:hypothetical protein